MLSLVSYGINFQHNSELENIDYVESLMEGFQNEGILPADGRIDPEDFEALRIVNDIQKETYLTLADNEDDRIAMERIWPWQDWPERTR